MGKTTTKYISKIQVLMDDCTQLSELYAVNYATKSKMFQQTGPLVEAHDKRTLQIQNEHDNVAGKYEPVIDRDPEIQKLNKQLDELKNSIAKISEKVRQLRQSLNTKSEALRKELLAFNTYIGKKKSSWKSKKSVPMAEKFIEEGVKFYKELP
ncbi:Hypothetical protein PBC10988_16430 [Planctomycetales bacterium 10988]|nr:Hypothetical protein PBC10988_16430 [Planctomycetales bacterium 10988]